MSTLTVIGLRAVRTWRAEKFIRADKSHFLPRRQFRPVTVTRKCFSDT